MNEQAILDRNIHEIGQFICEKKHHIRLLFAFSTLVIVSCSSADQSNSFLPVQDSAAPAPATEVVATENTEAPTADVDVASAGQRYLEIVNPVNCAIKAELAIQEENNLGNMMIDPSVLGELQSALGVVAATKQDAFRQMLDCDWPSNVQSEIEILAADWAKQASYYQGFADAFDLATFNYKVAAYLDLPPGQGNPSLIRGLLGVGTSAETDQC